MIFILCKLFLQENFFANSSEDDCHSVMSDSATPWTVARQVPLSMEFSRQEYWIDLPFPSPSPTQGLNLGHLQCRHILSSEPPGKP